MKESKLPPLNPVQDPQEVVVSDAVLGLTGLDKVTHVGELRAVAPSVEKAMRKIAGENADRTDADELPSDPTSEV